MEVRAVLDVVHADIAQKVLFGCAGGCPFGAALSAIIIVLKSVTILTGEAQSTDRLEGLAVACYIITRSITEVLLGWTRRIHHTNSTSRDDPRQSTSSASIEPIIIIDARKSVSRKLVAAALIDPIDIAEVIAVGTLEDISQVPDANG